jgi:hypothetical protein
MCFRNRDCAYGIAIPRDIPLKRVANTVGDIPIHILGALNDVAPRTSLDDLPLGQAVQSAPAPNRPITEIAPGIVQIPNSWYVTLVRQSDGIVVIDAPISAGYSKHVLDEVARRFPGTPIKAVITSTGFFWHIAGIREHAARGIPIYVCDRNLGTLRRLLAAPHILRPDDLARKAKVLPNLRPVSARTVIGAGPNMIVLFPIRQATQSMVMTLYSGRSSAPHRRDCTATRTKRVLPFAGIIT